MCKDHRTLIKFSLLELHTLDLLRNFAIKSQTGSTRGIHPLKGSSSFSQKCALLVSHICNKGSFSRHFIANVLFFTDIGFVSENQWCLGLQLSSF